MKKIGLVFEKYSHIRRFLDGIKIRKAVNNFGTIGYGFRRKHQYLAVPVIETAHTLNLLPTIVDDLGYRTLIRIGTCGVLSQCLRLGDFGLVASCANKDILSERLLPNCNPAPSAALSKRLSTINGVTKISAFTLDVLWQPAEIKAETVDMESTALLCFADSRKARAASLSLFRDRRGESLSREHIEEAISKMAADVVRLMEAVW